MVAMSADAQMSEADDDSITTETPDGFTFHTSPAMVERVRLPTTAEYVWTATASDTAMVTIGEASNEFELGLEGPLHRVIKVTPKAAGKATVTFERRKVSSPDVIETRSIHFMVH
jgi:hypothetical protein